MSGAGWLKRLF